MAEGSQLHSIQISREGLQRLHAGRVEGDLEPLDAGDQLGGDQRERHGTELRREPAVRRRLMEVELLQTERLLVAIHEGEVHPLEVASGGAGVRLVIQRGARRDYLVTVRAV